MAIFSQSFRFTIFIFYFASFLRNIISAEILPVLAGNYLRDLYSLDKTTGAMAELAQSWEINGIDNPTQAKTSYCAYNPIVGGVGILQVGDFIERTYDSLPAHQEISFTMLFFAIDGWQSGDTIEISFDGVLAYSLTPSLVIAAQGSDHCGSSQPETIGWIVGEVAHSSSSLTFKIISSRLNMGNFAWMAISNLQMTFLDILGSSLLEPCLKSNINDSSIPGVCNCQYGTYYDPASADCQPCHYSCSECTGPTENDCIGCADGYTYILETCISCASNCFLCTGPNSHECLVCQDNYYLYWDNICRPECNSPYNIETVAQICYTPCQPQNEFMLWDNTCSPSCNLPLVERIEGQAKFCDFPCEGDTKFYYPNDGECRTECPYPYTIQNNVFCIINLSSDEASKMKNIVETEETVGIVTDVVGTSISLINYNNPSGIFVNTFADMIKKIKYIDIQYPSNLQYCFDIPQKNPFLTIPENLKAKLPDVSLQKKFKKYQLHSSFLVNFWQSGIILSALLLICLALLALKFFTKKFTKFQSLCISGLKVFQWNLLISLFISYSGNIIFNSSFEFETANPNTFLSVLSFQIVTIVNIMVFVVFFKMIYVVLTRQKSNRKPNLRTFSTKKAPKDLSNYEVVYKTFKDTFILQTSYMIIFAGRLCLFCGIIAYLYNYPLSQAILITILSALMLVYLVIRRPFKSYVDLTQNILQELVVFTAKTSVLILAVFDHDNIENFNTRERLGNVIIACNLTLRGISTLYLAVRIILLLIKTYQLISQTQIRKPTLPEQHISLVHTRVKNLEHKPSIVQVPQRVRARNRPMNQLVSDNDFSLEFQHDLILDLSNSDSIKNHKNPVMERNRIHLKDSVLARAQIKNLPKSFVKSKDPIKKPENRIRKRIIRNEKKKTYES